MWKREDDGGVDAHLPKVTSKEMFETSEMSLESAKETLIEAYRNRNPERPNVSSVLKNYYQSTVRANNNGDVLKSGG